MSNSTELLERALEELYTAYRGKRHYPDIFLDIHKYLALEPDRNIDISVIDDETHAAISEYLSANKEGLCHWSFCRGVLWAIKRTKQAPAEGGGADNINQSLEVGK